MGLIFDMTEDALGSKWREYAEGVRILIRPMTRSEFRRIRAAAAKAADRLKTDRDAELDRRLYEHMVAGWEGIVDTGGTPIPVTPENIHKVCDRAIDLATWITEQSQSMGSGREAQEEEALKN